MTMQPSDGDLQFARHVGILIGAGATHKQATCFALLSRLQNTPSPSLTANTVAHIFFTHVHPEPPQDDESTDDFLNDAVAYGVLANQALIRDTRFHERQRGNDYDEGLQLMEMEKDFAAQRVRSGEKPL